MAPRTPFSRARGKSSGKKETGDTASNFRNRASVQALNKKNRPEGNVCWGNLMFTSDDKSSAQFFSDCESLREGQIVIAIMSSGNPQSKSSWTGNYKVISQSGKLYTLEALQ